MHIKIYHFIVQQMGVRRGGKFHPVYPLMPRELHDLPTEATFPSSTVMGKTQDTFAIFV